MSHVRHVNTLGFPDAGVQEEGYFSVVLSSRTGSVDNSTYHVHARTFFESRSSWGPDSVYIALRLYIWCLY
jgi:hypothetical protein